MSMIGKEFMEKTKYKYMEDSDQEKGIVQPLLELGYGEKDILIDLPSPKNIVIEDINLRKAIEKRASIRQYSESPLSLEELTYLLWCTQGVKNVVPGRTRRNVPSAGARHSFETYLLINNVYGLEKGLYRYLAIENKLLLVSTDNNITEKVTKACMGQKMVENSAVTFIWGVVVERMYWRYGERGYRYMHLDAGHVCQNLYLAAESIKSGVCAIAAYDDDEINELLKLDGEDQFVIYIAAVGKKKY